MKWCRSPNRCRGGLLLLVLLLAQPARAQEVKEPLWEVQGGSTWVGFSPDGKAAWSSGFGSTNRIWVHDVKNGRKAVSDDLESSIVAVGVNHVFAVGGAQTGITLYQWQGGDTFKQYSSPVGKKEKYVLSLAFDKDCKVLLSTHEEGNVNLWEVKTGKMVGLGVHAEATTGALSGDGKLAVTGGVDKTVQVWDCAKEKRLHRLTGHEEKVNSVAIARDGRLALSGSEDKTARVWDVGTGKELHKLDAGFLVYGVALSPDGKRGLVAGAEGNIVLYDLGTGKRLKSFVPEDKWAVSSVAFSPDGKTALSGSHNQKVRLWELP